MEPRQTRCQNISAQIQTDLWEVHSHIENLRFIDVAMVRFILCVHMEEIKSLSKPFVFVFRLLRMRDTPSWRSGTIPGLLWWENIIFSSTQKTAQSKWWESPYWRSCSFNFDRKLVASLIASHILIFSCQYDIKNRRQFLKRSVIDGLNLHQLYIGAIINIHSRQVSSGSKYRLGPFIL